MREGETILFRLSSTTARSTDHFFAAQFVDGCRRQTCLPQDLVGMLSRRRRRQAGAAFFANESHGVAHAVETTGCGVIVLHD